MIRGGWTLLLLACAALLVAAGCSKEYRRQRDLGSKDPKVRAAAARRIAKERPKGAVATLVKLLEDRAPRVRVEAANGLGKLKAKGAVSPLGAALRDPDPRVRLAVVRALARLGREVASDHLLTAAEDNHPKVRRAARFALQDLGVDRAEQMRRIVQRRVFKQRRMLVNRLPARRVEAARVLGRSGRQSVVSDLQQRVGDPYVKVAEAAAEALGMIGGAKAAAFLERLSAQSAHGKRLARLGFLALLQGRGPEAAPLARRLLADKDPELQRAALDYLLAKVPGVPPAGPEVLCRLLSDPDAERAVGWAEALRRARVSCPQRVGALTRSTPLDPKVRAWVAGALAPGKPSPPAAVAIAAARGDARLRALLLKRVEADYATLLTASERWLDERQWKRLEGLPTVKGVAVPPSKATTQPVAPRLDEKKRKLKRLLDRFPKEQAPGGELLPPRVDFRRLTWQLRWLAEVEAAQPFFAKLVRKSPPQVRLAALRALQRGRCDRPECLTAWNVASADPTPAVRAAAVTLYGRVKGVDPKRLVLLLDDPVVAVRAAAAAALVKHRVKGTYAELLKRFRKSRQTYLIEAFGALADKRAEKVLLALLREDHTPLRVGQRLAVVEALDKVATRASVARLVVELEHPEPALRLAAARVLARVGDQRALEPLASCAEDFYRVVRRACRATRAALQKGRK